MGAELCLQKYAAHVKFNNIIIKMTKQEVFNQTSQILKNIEAQFIVNDLQDKEWSPEDHAKFLHDMNAIIGVMKTEVTKLALVVDVNAKKSPSLEEVKSVSQGKTRQRALTSVGEVWQKCDDLIQKSSQDNVQAVILEIKQQRSLIKDAITELEESKQDPDEEWTDQDLTILNPGLGLLKTVQATLMKVVTALKAKGDPWKSVQDMDGILDQCQKLSPAVDELALTLYPPMIFSDIQTKSEILIELILDTIEALKHVHFVSNQDFDEWGTFLLKGVDHNKGKLELALTDVKLDEMSIKE